MTRWHRTRAASSLAWLGLAGLCGLAAGPGEAWAREPALKGAVTRVSDGDTLWLRPAGGRPVKLRLLGIDAPELCQALGPQAHAALRQRVLHRQAEAEVRARDAYGRLLVVLNVDGQDVAAVLVAQGLAWSEGQRGRGPYEAEQREARAAGLGVHADPAAERPRDFRRRHGPCAS